ncbi:MAG: hypothetical protein AB8F95_05780 [Bacteroidia bacterium]
MTIHAIIFEKFKALLKKHFEDQLEEFDEGLHVSLRESGLWIASDDQELTVGFDRIHNHYDPRYQDVQEAIDLFFNLLTKQIRITQYYKGAFAYKYTVDIVFDETEFETFGTAGTWLFPYWKRTTEKTSIVERLIEPSELEQDFIELKKYLSHENLSQP